MEKSLLGLWMEHCLTCVPAGECKLKQQLLKLHGAFISVSLCLCINTGFYVCSVVSVLWQEQLMVANVIKP